VWVPCGVLPSGGCLLLGCLPAVLTDSLQSGALCCIPHVVLPCGPTLASHVRKGMLMVHTFPSVSFHRCRCVSVKCVERVLSVLEARVNVCRGKSLRRLRGERFGRYRCLTLRYSLLLSVWVDPSAEHREGRGEPERRACLWIRRVWICARKVWLHWREEGRARRWVMNGAVVLERACLW